MDRRRVLRLGTTAVVAGLAGCQGTKTNLGTDTANETAETTEGKPSTGTGEETDPDTEPGPGSEAENVPVEELPTMIGGTLNGRPRVLDGKFPVLEKSSTTWLHAFFDVRGKLDRGVKPRSDPDVNVLRRVTTERNRRLIVNLMWDFEGMLGNKDEERVPEPGSSREAALFEYATKLLEAIGHPPDIIVLGNEPMWDTPEEDLKGSDAAFFPFTRNLKNHLVENYSGDESRLLLGSLNRLHDGYLERHFPTFRRKFFEMARNDDDIDGVDVHVHFKRSGNAEEMVATAREEVPDGIVTTTELSPAGRYNQHKDEAIGKSDAGQQFANRYDLPDGMTVREYFGKAIQEPRPPEEIGAFYDAMPWYNVNFIDDMYSILNKYDATVGTPLFVLPPGLGNTNWPKNWMPFPLNALFQMPLIDTRYGAHPHYLEDFRARSGD